MPQNSPYLQHSSFQLMASSSWVSITQSNTLGLAVTLLSHIFYPNHQQIPKWITSHVPSLCLPWFGSLSALLWIITIAFKLSHLPHPMVLPPSLPQSQRSFRALRSSFYPKTLSQFLFHRVKAKISNNGLLEPMSSGTTPCSFLYDLKSPTIFPFPHFTPATVASLSLPNMSNLLPRHSLPSTCSTAVPSSS